MRSASRRLRIDPNVGASGTPSHPPAGTVVVVVGWSEVEVEEDVGVLVVDVVDVGASVDVVVVLVLVVDVAVVEVDVEEVVVVELVVVEVVVVEVSVVEVSVVEVSVVEVSVVEVVVVVGATGHAENSEVSPLARSVAVAVKSVAPIGCPKVTVKPTSPFASVAAVSTVPTKIFPSPLSVGSHSSFANTSMRKVWPGVELSVPVTLDPPGKSGALSSGKFCRPFAPGSGSIASFMFTPAGSRSMPSPPFSKNELPLIRKPSSPLSTNTPAKPLKAMTLPSPAPVPPIVSGPSETWSPNRPLPTAIVPLGSVPTRLPWMTLFFVKAPSKTPSNVLPEMTLPAPAAEPPMVRTRESLPAPKLAMPIWFGSATVPVLSVPMRFPWIVAADRDGAGSEHDEAMGGARSVELDQRHGVDRPRRVRVRLGARLHVAVDRDRIRDELEVAAAGGASDGRDGPDAASRDVERDRVHGGGRLTRDALAGHRSGSRVRVGRDDRLAQRAGAVVGRGIGRAVDGDRAGEGATGHEEEPHAERYPQDGRNGRARRLAAASSHGAPA